MPVRLDDTAFDTDESWAAKVRQRHLSDLRQGNQHEAHTRRRLTGCYATSRQRTNNKRLLCRTHRLYVSVSVIIQPAVGVCVR